MQAIKFRYYSKKKSRMLTWDYVKMYSMSALEDNADGESYSPWMQYTGLRDKNGVEIYEGDIVDVQDEGYPFIKNWNGIVKMIDGSYLIENMKGDDGEYLFDEERDVEVIGNIYNNPELHTQ